MTSLLRSWTRRVCCAVQQVWPPVTSLAFQTLPGSIISAPNSWPHSLIHPVHLVHLIVHLVHIVEPPGQGRGSQPHLAHPQQGSAPHKLPLWPPSPPSSLSAPLTSTQASPPPCPTSPSPPPPPPSQEAPPPRFSSCLQHNLCSPGSHKLNFCANEI